MGTKEILQGVHDWIEENSVQTGSYDATVAVGLADNLRGDTVVNAEFYKRKTAGTQSVGSGITAIKEVRGKSIVWNQLVNTDTTEVTTISGHKYLTKINGVKSIITSTGAAITISDATTDQVFDLTLMFGADNEPATVEEFEKMFPLDYYDYNAGEIIPFAGQNLVTTGFNMLKVKGRVAHIGDNLTPTSKRNFSEGEYWNGFAYNGYFNSTYKQTNVTIDEGQVSATPINMTYGIGFPIKCEPNTQYYYKTTYGAVGFFDKEGINIGSYSEIDGVFTTPINAAWMVIVVGRTTGAYTESNLVVNVSNTDRNGTYEPYERRTLPLDPSQWRDKQGNLVFPYGGMHGVGTAYDYAKVDADGYIRKAVRCFGQVDLGTLTNWVKRAGFDDVFQLPNPNLPYAPKYELGVMSSKYICGITGNGDSVGLEADKTLWLYYSAPSPTIKFLYIKDSSCSTIQQLMQAINGVMLIYELAEPVEVELATPVYAKYLVEKDGTEEITPANGTKPYTAPANLSILYAMDARGEIKNLPKGYLSKESAENMLNAMVAAGVIQSYTMTYDAANARYQFTFVKA